MSGKIENIVSLPAFLRICGSACRVHRNFCPIHCRERRVNFHLIVTNKNINSSGVWLKEQGNGYNPHLPVSPQYIHSDSTVGGHSSVHHYQSPATSSAFQSSSPLPILKCRSPCHNLPIKVSLTIITNILSSLICFHIHVNGSHSQHKLKFTLWYLYLP